MQKTDLKGMVILLKTDKSLIQTRKIRICQRENMIDKLHFLVPLIYEDLDMTPFTITMVYVCPDGTVLAETLKRMSDSLGNYIDYEDADGNPTHMIYELPVSSSFTQFSGDITVKLTMDHIDQAAQTSSGSDDEEAPDPEPVHYVFNSDSTIIHVLANADYYSAVSDASMSIINQKIADLEAKQKALEQTANIYDQTKGDSIELHIDKYSQCIRLLSHGRPIGKEIDLNELGDAVSDWQEAGLVRVITDEDEPEPAPVPSEEYANDIVLVVDEQTRAIYLLSNGKKIGNPIYLEDLGTAISDATEAGLIKVVTDDDNSVISDD